MRQRNDLVFPIAEYERRLTDLRRRMTERGIDVMLSTTPENICYLTGFDSPGHYWFQALIVPLDGEPVTVSRLLEASGVEALTWLEHNHTYADSDDAMKRLRDSLAEFEFHQGRIGYEKDCWFFTAAQQERLFAYCPDASFVDCSGIIEEGRLIKSEYEIRLMEQAARTAEAGMRAGVNAVRAGVTENDVAAEVNYALIKAGSHWPSIVPFVASGERGAIGHATWADRPIRPGDSVFLEVGGCRHRYHAALLRTIIAGEADDDIIRANEIVQQAFELAVQTIKPGITAGDVDKVAREFIAESDFSGTQASRTAYSIGVAVPPDWGEGHILSMKPGESRELQANMTFHLLPFVQIPGKAGFGCSETVRVTHTGCERITEFSRDLLVVPANRN
jgi:Xaa-Pro dipeptidase